MAKGTYVGVGGVAKKVKKAYIGIGGAAKKVKKIYVGVGGVPKIVYSADFGYYGTATDLTRDASGAVSVRKATDVGKTYVIFVDGSVYNDYFIADTYNNSLVKSSITMSNYTSSGGRVSASKNANYAIFGIILNVGNGDTKFCAFNSSLVQSHLSGGRWYYDPLSGTHVGVYALFSDSGYIYAFNGSLVFSSVTIGAAKRSAATDINNNYAIFAGGGAVESPQYIVSALNSSLVSVTISHLTTARYACAGASVGNNALIAGGTTVESGGYSYYTVSSIERYDSSLVKLGNLSLSTSATGLFGDSVDGYAIFCGGTSGYSNPGGSSSTDLDFMDIFDENLVRTTLTLPEKMVSEPHGASNANYFLLSQRTIKKLYAYNF